MTENERTDIEQMLADDSTRGIERELEALETTEVHPDYRALVLAEATRRDMI